MMWRIFNRLFGWHYGVIENPFGKSVGRVTVAPNGDAFINYLGNGLYKLELRDGSIYGDSYLITPLTFNALDLVKNNKE